ncbi:MAG: glutaredoxin family protein [Nanoarchaeota archaeon]|nr:glutaredoxin family protein [Nanoarchaeota archaeon]
MKEHKIVMYGTPSCHWCKKAKEFFVEKGVKYEYIDVQADQEKAKEMVEKSGQMGVPVIDIDGEILVGFEEDKIKKILEID